MDCRNVGHRVRLSDLLRVRKIVISDTRFVEHSTKYWCMAVNWVTSSQSCVELHLPTYQVIIYLRVRHATMWHLFTGGSNLLVVHSEKQRRWTPCLKATV